MRTFLAAAVIAIPACAVQAQEVQGQELQVGESVAAVPAERVLQPRVQQRLEALGYKDLQVSEDVLVVRAKDESDQAIVLLVDPETLLNIKIDELGHEPSTTGRGGTDR